jgi:hypothetical protein
MFPLSGQRLGRQVRLHVGGVNGNKQTVHLVLVSGTSCDRVVAFDFEFGEGVLVIGEFELMTRAVDVTAFVGSDTESYFKVYAEAG